MDDPATILELVGITRRYGHGDTEVCALSDVSLAVARGEMVAVMGPSGSGKSTLLSIAGTLELPSAGDIRIDGVLVSAMDRTELARLRRVTIGFVFQDFNLLPGLSALENVTLPLELDGCRTRLARVAAHDALAAVGLDDKVGRFPDELSGGERQRVAIARAIVGERHLLLADEPSGALDSANAEAVMQLIRSACHGGVAAVVVTHDAHLAALADRTVHLLDGRLLETSADRP